MENNNFLWYVFVFLFGLGVFSSINAIFYSRKNRFYITNQGIGFERRNWFKMQKKFFKFGEVGIAINFIPTPLYFETSVENFIIYPINLTFKPIMFSYIRDKNYKHYTFCKIFVQLSLDTEKSILAFIRQKTKEALESQGISISDEELKDKIKDLWHKDI